MDTNCFFSIDKLLEFGMGIAVANQMVAAMNQAMQQMSVPGVSHASQSAVPAQIYYAILDGNQAGPFSEGEMTRLIIGKKVNKDTFIWKPGMTDWAKAGTVPDVLRLVALTPPEYNK